MCLHLNIYMYINQWSITSVWIQTNFPKIEESKNSINKLYVKK